jgi:hypothetical protein
MLPETDPAVRVAYHVRAMLTPPEWPAAYLRSIWKRLAADLAEVEWKARQRQRIFDMAANITDPAASARFWTLVADALLARDRIRDAEYEAHDMAVPGRIDADDLAAAAVTVARFGDRGLATALIEAAEARVEEGDPFGVRPDIAAGYRAIGDRRGPVVLAQVLAWLEDLLDRRPPSFISVNFTVSQAIATLADQYDGLAADEAAMAALLRNCAAIDDLGARTDALESLAAAAARAAERSDPANDPRFTQAARIVALIPIAPRQADALRLLLGTLAGGPATGADPAVWAPLLDVAERTVEGTVECAKRWALNYVREAADGPGADARVAELLAPDP